MPDHLGSPPLMASELAGRRACSSPAVACVRLTLRCQKDSASCPSFVITRFSGSISGPLTLTNRLRSAMPRQPQTAAEIRAAVVAVLMSEPAVGSRLNFLCHRSDCLDQIDDCFVQTSTPIELGCRTLHFRLWFGVCFRGCPLGA